MEAPRFNGIGEGADDGFLADDLIECLGPKPESNDAGFIHRLVPGWHVLVPQRSRDCFEPVQAS